MNIIILGAGITGLTVASKLAIEGKYKVKLLEKNNYVGGLCSSFKYKNFLLDYGPHKIYTQNKDVQSYIEKLMGKNLLKVHKKYSVYFKGKYIRFPFRTFSLILILNPFLIFYWGISFLLTKVKNFLFGVKINTYEDYIINKFGQALYNSIFKQQANKIWGNPKELSKELGNVRASLPDLKIMALRNLSGKLLEKSFSSAFFFYPKGGMIELIKKMSDIISDNNGQIELDISLKGINVEKNKIKSVILEKDGKIQEIYCDFLVSTIPITQLVEYLGENLSTKTMEAAKKLMFRNLILFYLVVNKKQVTEENWIFYPEEKFIFNRLFEQKTFCREMIPEAQTAICVDIICDLNSNIWNMKDQEIFEIIIKQLETTSLLSRKDVADYFSKRIKSFYPIYCLNYKNQLNTILNEIDKISNLITVGRLGLFNYNNMDHCMDMGFTAVNYITNGKHEGKLWAKEREKFENYRIID